MNIPLLPEEKAFYDTAAAQYKTTRRTFTESEAMAPAIELHNDLPMQYDYANRFVKVDSSVHNIEPHWRLREHMLANDRLFNDLLSGAWDGQGLDERLAALDRENQQHHIFYPLDTRLRQDGKGIWEPVSERLIRLPTSIKEELDLLKTALIAHWQEQPQLPHTGQQVLTLLMEVGWTGADQARAFHYIRTWLQQTPEFARVGQDYWLLAKGLPEGVQRIRLAVLPQHDVDDKQGDQSSQSIIPQALRAKISRQPIESQISVAGDLGKLSARWLTSLRTIHLQEGFIPVPRKVRNIYPPLASGEGDVFVLPGRWFDDARALWIWIDRKQHRLYGPELRQLFDNELLDPGTTLQIEWEPSTLLIRRMNINEKVFSEETRLINLEELKALRGGIGESYRRSLQTILTKHPHGLTLAELVDAMYQHQKHVVHHGTIRTLLYSGGFIQKAQHWFAAPDNARGARQLRRAMLEALVPQEHITTKPAPYKTFVRTRALAIQKRLQEIRHNLK